MRYDFYWERFQQRQSRRKSRSETIMKLLSALHEKGEMFASELAEVIHDRSNEIYPRLKRWIEAGFVKVRKNIPFDTRNIYGLSEKWYELFEEKGTEAVLKKAEQTLGRELTEEEKEVLTFFCTHKQYIERDSMDKSIVDTICALMKWKIPSYKVEQILHTFINHGIIFAYRPRRGLILKVRLDRKYLTLLDR